MHERHAAAGQHTSLTDALHCAQDLMNRLGCGNLYSDGGFPDHDADVRSNYIMNSSIQGADQADVILLIGSNPRLEAPVFNARCALSLRARLSAAKLLSAEALVRQQLLQCFSAAQYASMA